MSAGLGDVWAGSRRVGAGAAHKKAGFGVIDVDLLTTEAVRCGDNVLPRPGGDGAGDDGIAGAIDDGVQHDGTVLAGDGVPDGDGRRDGQFGCATDNGHRLNSGNPSCTGLALMKAVPGELAALITARRVGGGLNPVLVQRWAFALDTGRNRAG